MKSSRLLLSWSLLAVALHGVEYIGARAQNLTPSPNWRKANITNARSDRVSIADGAVQQSLANINQTTGQFKAGGAWDSAANFYVMLINYDDMTGQTKYHDALVDYFNGGNVLRPGFQDEFLNYGLAWGYAAARAYQVYKDPQFLSWAQEVWEYGAAFTISAGDVAAKQTQFKSFPISPSCQGITMAGGTFWNTDFNDPSIVSLGTGSFLITSAVLAETTGNQTYLDAASASIGFTHAHLYNIQSIVQDSISARQNDSCSTSQNTSPYNSGLFLEGLAILANITKNDTLTDLLVNTVSSVVPFGGWQGDNGIIAQGSGKSGDQFIARGLATAYYRNPSNTNLRNYIKSYLGVQYNALLDLATTGDNNYAGAWSGPAGSGFDQGNQTQALNVLVNTINFQLNESLSSNANSTSPPDTTSTSSPDKKSNAGAIAGGVVAGIAAIAVIAGLLLWRKRRRSGVSEVGGGRNKNRHSSWTIDETRPSNTLAPTPFNMPAEYHSTPYMSQANSPPEVPPHTRTLSSESMHPQETTESSGAPFLVSRPSIAKASRRPPQVPSQPSISTRPESSHPGSSSDGAGTAPSAIPAGLPTEELVRLLNERLQPENQWDNEEVPPTYR